MHWGKAGGNLQVKEVGLVWLPGFGTLLRSANDTPQNAYSTVMGKQSTYRKSILDFQLPQEFKNASANGEVQAGDLEFKTNFDGIGISKSYRITDGGLEVTTQTKEAAQEQLPLYFDDSDSIAVDGQEWNYKRDTPVAFTGRTLRVKRICGGQTAYATVEFGQNTIGTLTHSYDIARGAVYILSVAVPANTDFVTRVRKG